jgi:hypothetical protein
MIYPIGIAQLTDGLTEYAVTLTVTSFLPLVGSLNGGTIVTIIGTGFPSSIERFIESHWGLYIVDVDLTLISVTNTEIVASIPVPAVALTVDTPATVTLWMDNT